MSTYAHTHTSAYPPLWVYTESFKLHKHIHKRAYAYTHMSTYAHKHTSAYSPMYMPAYMCVFVHMCVYVHIQAYAEGSKELYYWSK